MHGFIRIITEKKKKREKWSQCVRISILAAYSACRTGEKQLIRTARDRTKKMCRVTKVAQLAKDSERASYEHPYVTALKKKKKKYTKKKSPAPQQSPIPQLGYFRE